MNLGQLRSICVNTLAGIAAAALCVGAAPAPAASLSGFWYGVGEPDDPAIFYIDYFHPDGTFNSEYRKCEKGKLIYQQTQSGKWSIAGGVLIINSDMIDGKPDRFDHYYKIESITDREVRATLVGNGFLFVENRIPAFEFPPCYLGS